MLKAVLFDFDGVIADAEPLHLKGFQSVLSAEGIILTEKDYYKYYLAFDDKTCLREVLRREGRDYGDAYIEELIGRKGEFYMEAVREHRVIFPGVERLVTELSEVYPLAIGSGARRVEIEYILDAAGLSEYFKVIVSADDIVACKPDPETYLRALERLNALGSGENVACDGIAPYECVVIEDSMHGVRAALGAGMRCIAVTNTYSREALNECADVVVDSLEELSVGVVESLLKD